MTGVLADMLPATVCLHVSDRDGNIVMSMHMMKEWKRTRLGRVETPPPRSRVLHFAHPFHATFLLPSQHHQRNNDKGHALITLPMWMLGGQGPSASNAMDETRFWLRDDIKASTVTLGCITACTMLIRGLTHLQSGQSSCAALKTSALTSLCSFSLRTHPLGRPATFTAFHQDVREEPCSGLRRQWYTRLGSH